MTPIEAIIAHYEIKARDLYEAAKKTEPDSNEEGYAIGKANGFQEAANFLKDLQKLFN